MDSSRSPGGQPGNNNATKNRPWLAAIERAIAKRTLRSQKEALDDLAEKLLSKCDRGDLSALQELGNRLDGRPHQSVGLENQDGGPPTVRHEIVFGKT